MGIPGALVPALLNRTSSRPNISCVLAKSALTESGLLTSVGTASIFPPEDFADAAVLSSSAARRPASTTEYPADCKVMATARPIPLPAPVTSATFWLFIVLVPPRQVYEMSFPAWSECALIAPHAAFVRAFITLALRSKFRMPRLLPLVGRAVFALACGFALYRSVRLGVADAFAFTGTSAGLSTAMAIEPASERYLAREAVWRSDSGDLSPEVDRKLARALAMNPLDASLMMTLGLRAEMRGDRQTAEHELARAAEVDHTFKPAWTLANFYF